MSYFKFESVSDVFTTMDKYFEWKFDVPGSSFLDFVNFVWERHDDGCYLDCISAQDQENMMMYDFLSSCISPGFNDYFFDDTAEMDTVELYELREKSKKSKKSS